MPDQVFVLKKAKDALHKAIAHWRNDHTVAEAVDAALWVTADDLERIQARHDPATLCKLFYLMGATGWTLKEAERYHEGKL